jgi:hypothetical protein
VTKKYAADFVEALAELSNLEADRDALEIKIARQKKRVAALAALAIADDDENKGEFSGLVDGITDACRVVFRAAEKPLLPIEVRDRVQALGLPPQANLLASVHTTIRRMKAAGEITEVFEPKGGQSALAAYKWSGESAIDRFKKRLASVTGKTDITQEGSE